MAVCNIQPKWERAVAKRWFCVMWLWERVDSVEGSISAASMCATAPVIAVSCNAACADCRYRLPGIWGSRCNPTRERLLKRRTLHTHVSVRERLCSQFGGVNDVTGENFVPDQVPNMRKDGLCNMVNTVGSTITQTRLQILVSSTDGDIDTATYMCYLLYS